MSATEGPRRRPSESELGIEIERLRAVCPLSADEITDWARKLKGRGAEHELRLKNLVTYWFAQASSFYHVSQETDTSRVRDYFNRRLARGDPLDTISLRPHFDRIDKWLPDLSNRLSATRGELLDLPGDVAAELRARFADYDRTLDELAALAVVLNTLAKAWHRPSPGQPSLKMKSDAVGLLIFAVECFTEEEFPSPRSYKRTSEIEFVRLLAGRMFPGSSRSEIDTMLRHFHNRRRSKLRSRRTSAQKRQL